jgi:thiaminase (transcriptional activator TenA)
MSDTLSHILWGQIEDIYALILEHPFIQGLSAGSLENDAFRFYVVQDALYLREYARALAICAAKAPHDVATRMFCEHASGAIAVEQQLHDRFFTEFGLDHDVAREAEMAPVNLAYTSYLLAAAYSGSFAEALGAVLPCYWIYWEVGKALRQRGSPNPLYRKWIETYGGEEFANIVRAVLALTDDIGEGLSPSEKLKVIRCFRMTARFEWMFWDMGYRKEGWPV